MAFGLSKTTVRFLANAGVLIYTRKQKILIDGLHRGEGEMATGVDEAVLAKITEGKDIFKGLDLLVFSHEHGDHFDSALTIEAMTNIPGLHLIGPKKVTDALREDPSWDDGLSSRIWTMDMAVGKSTRISMRGIDIESVGTEHDAIGRNCPVNNATVLTVGRKTFLHMGDAKGVKANFEEVEAFRRPIDVMFVPFTYTGIAEAREAVTALAPKKLVIMHMPDSEKDNNNWSEKAHLAYTQNASSLPPAVFFEKDGDGFTL